MATTSNDFYAAVRSGNYPAVSFVKLAIVQDDHPGYSDPLDEQIGTGQADQLPAAAAGLEFDRRDHRL